MGFLVTIMVTVVVVHYYLWRRLVRPTTVPGSSARRLLTWVLVALAALLPLTFGGSRFLGGDAAHVLAWPGYLWLAVMFYLFVYSLALEIPRAIALLAARRARPVRRTAAEPSSTPAPATGTMSAADPVGASATTAVETTVAVETRPGGDAEDGLADPADRRPGPDEAAIGRRLFISRTAAAAVGVGALATVGYGTRVAQGDPVIERVPVRLSRLDPRMSGLRFAVVSDIHLGPLTGRGHTERIVRMINGLQADVVAIVGDLVDGTVAELGPLATPLRSLESRYGAYFVTGNHEYYTVNGPQEWIDELDSLGVRSLRNERVEISHAGAVLDLAGVNDLTGQAMGDGPDMAKALSGRDQARPVVLLAHQPLQVEQAAGYGVDLQLSGHTHGGQMVPFNLLVPLQQPVVAGLAEIPRATASAGAPGTGPDVTRVYVTRGAGFWGPPVRVGAPPEITLLELMP
ncbi:metallophosphoesterase [Sphaerimonospora sp. CA-214678]|uniref:metallophosphoesterase n=1 Tax=Sphaerimonospora sp. CA-214678 TaxID=3240029 RepID=UPI003D89E6CC